MVFTLNDNKQTNLNYIYVKKLLLYPNCSYCKHWEKHDITMVNSGSLLLVYSIQCSMIEKDMRMENEQML